MVEVKRINGNIVLTLPQVPEGAIVHRELMGEHYVKFPFTLAEPVYFRIGDYVENAFGRFELIAPYRPKYNTETCGYDYELKLDAYYMKWENKKCKYLPYTSSTEVSFHLTATADVHLEMIVRNVNALGERDASFRYNGKDFTYKLSNFPASKVNTAKYVYYNGLGILSALDAIAEAFDCEWWVEGNCIYLGKCQLDGEEIEFTIDENVEDMKSSESKNEYATRLIAFGSTRNLPKNYRKYTSADVTKDGVVQRRLMLPITGEHACPNGYIQDSDVKNEAEAIEAIFVDESIFPKTECEVSEVIPYKDTQTDPDTGEEIIETFYRLKDKSSLKFSTDYILEGETLHILFLSGVMNGMDFECQYNDDEKYYEVVVNEDYGRSLPDNTLHPAVGDKFVLYGWDSTKIGNTGLVTTAEEELRMATLDKLADMKIDPNTYTCQMESDKYLAWMESENKIFHSLGQKVKLNNIAYFENGRSSRIIGYEIKLDIPYDTPEYTVGEASAYSRSKDMQSQLNAITYNGVTYTGGGGRGGSGNGSGGVYLITTTDTTPSSDYNAYSAAKADKNFLRRNKADTAQKRITHLEQSQHNMGIQIGKEFVSGLVGIGGRIDGQANAELRSLVLRTWLEVPELRYNKQSVYIGVRWDTFGGGIVEEVHPAEDGSGTGWLKLKLEKGEYGAVDEFDLEMGIWHDGRTYTPAEDVVDIYDEEYTTIPNADEDYDDRKGNFLFAGFKTVYFMVTGTSGANNEIVEYMLRSEADGGNGIHPFAGMHFAARGNTNNPDRQSFEYHTTVPYSLMLTGVNTWEFQPSNYVEIRGNLEGFSMQALDMAGNVYTKVFHGVGQVFGNAYIFGTLDSFERFQVRMEVESEMGYSLYWGESTLITCKVMKGFSDITNTVASWEITRNSGDEDADKAWLLKQKVKNFAGVMVISFNLEENDLGEGLATQFNIVAKGDADEPIAKALVTF